VSVYVFMCLLVHLLIYEVIISVFLSFPVYLFVSVGLEMELCASKGASVLIATLFIHASFKMGTHRLLACT
jgi:hypothetical protein